ncbi:TetR/AcrR family transcriptional regulator [Galbibacter pacificus]|uniref:TetR family transcriptional regulator n=1 Tax=Galbibacter pacificus TaxID=2996052 RepID=A0ABT6FVR3_9FLAO|nr:TetR family transcriptional regulator [Galbibacter pacificus]MDG3583728.1 TetR family transcriptional regulator [Galbibacter pacificus]MDG3587354.1 TetR family transcriptional regulator [Galbibacter pacificus]
MEFNEKQIHIFEVTERMFAENSYDGTSIRAIAKEAGINIAMISYYFGSKEKLLEQLLNYKTANFTIELESALSSSDDYLKKVDNIITLLVRRIHKNRRVYKIIHFEYSNGNRQIDFESYLKTKKENYSIIERFIKNGQLAGVFSKDVNIPLIVPTVLGTYFNFYYNKRSYEATYQLDPNVSLDDFVHTTLTDHIKRAIKALLTYEMPIGN